MFKYEVHDYEIFKDKKYFYETIVYFLVFLKNNQIFLVCMERIPDAGQMTINGHKHLVDSFRDAIKQFWYEC